MKLLKALTLSLLTTLLLGTVAQARPRHAHVHGEGRHPKHAHERTFHHARVTARRSHGRTRHASAERRQQSWAYRAAASRHAKDLRVAAKADRTGAVRVAMRYLGSRNPTGTRGPWCADFMNLLERRTGHPGLATRSVTPWLHYGHPTGPVAGAIAVFRGHVARVVQRLGDVVQVVSGNYHHRVAIGYYPVRTALAYRMY